MRQNYDFDKMLQYTVEQLDGNILINHPSGGENYIAYFSMAEDTDISAEIFS